MCIVRVCIGGRCNPIPTRLCSRQYRAGTGCGFAGAYIEFPTRIQTYPWIKNCVAVGLSAGFIEPLEASALAMIEQATASLVNPFPQTVI